MKESNLQSKFGVWLKTNKMEGVFELKLEKGKSEVRDITLEAGRKSLKQEEWETLAIRNIML